MRLPKSVRFPFGYVCRVKQVTTTEMKQLADVESSDADDIPDGLWEVDTQTIYIIKSLPVRRKRYVLGHELAHAFFDWQHFCLDSGAMRN